MQKLKPYPTYKDSGVPWLGGVPEHWEVQRLKHVCRLAYGDALASEVRQDGDVPVYGSNGRVGFHSIPNTLQPCLVIGRKGSFGKVNFSSRAVFAIDTTFYVDARTSSSDIRWLYYLLGWLRLDEVSKDSAIPGLAREEAYQRLAPLSPLPEQSAIVRYLDYKDWRIQRYIRAKQKLIKLLEEQKQAIIHQAVTGRIDVRTGKPYPAYKPSGVEWLQEVPEHWTIRSLSSICDLLVDGTHFSPKNDSDGVFPYITAKNIKESGVDTSRVSFISAKDHQDIYRRCPVSPGDVLYIKDGATAGTATVNTLPEPFSMLSSVALIRPTAGVLSSHYLSLQLNDSQFKKCILRDVVGGAMTRFTIAILKRFSILVPSGDEQNSITESLGSISSHVDQARLRTEQEIALLREYRTRLISDVVTGKLDVREAAANLPDELKDEYEEDQEQVDEADEALEDEEQTEDEA